MNTGVTAKPTPLEIAAAVETKGAVDHISQVTLFGFVCPLNIERMYAKAASRDPKAATNTRYSNIVYIMKCQRYLTPAKLNLFLR